MTITCPFECRKERSHCEMSPVGEDRLDQVGGFVPATLYAAADCPLLVTTSIRSGDFVLDPTRAHRIA